MFQLNQPVTLAKSGHILTKLNMNEQIRQIAEQAGFDVESLMISSPTPFQILGSTKQFENFAKLIVWECMELGDNALKDGKWPGDVIKKHFGVE